MRKLYVCPHCKSEHHGYPSGYEDGGGDYGDENTPIFDCNECGNWFTGDEGFIGWEGQLDNNPNDDIPFDEDEIPFWSEFENWELGAYDD